MLDKDSLTTPRPFFKKIDYIIHIDEKWFYMTKGNNNYYLLPEEPRPLRIVQNNNGKVIFLTSVANPTYDEEGEATFDRRIGAWAFVKETLAKKLANTEIKGRLN
jgi:hypothetical protein